VTRGFQKNPFIDAVEEFAANTAKSSENRPKKRVGSVK
jgi:hypothetical protein